MANVKFQVYFILVKVIMLYLWGGQIILGLKINNKLELCVIRKKILRSILSSLDFIFT